MWRLLSGTYIPRKEVVVLETIKATVIRENQAIRLRARKEGMDRGGVHRVTGKEHQGQGQPVRTGPELTAGQQSRSPRWPAAEQPTQQLHTGQTAVLMIQFAVPSLSCRWHRQLPAQCRPLPVERPLLAQVVDCVTVFQVRSGW